MRSSHYPYITPRPPRPGDRVAVPGVCPACRSAAIASVARNPDENAYWRCDSCGEVWNAGRRGPG